YPITHPQDDLMPVIDLLDADLLRRCSIAIGNEERIAYYRLVRVRRWRAELQTFTSIPALGYRKSQRKCLDFPPRPVGLAQYRRAQCLGALAHPEARRLTCKE